MESKSDLRGNTDVNTSPQSEQFVDKDDDTSDEKDKKSKIESKSGLRGNTDVHSSPQSEQFVDKEEDTSEAKDKKR
jgi:hypothetical protein